MATDGKHLQGEISKNPLTDHKDTEKLLIGFIEAFILENAEDKNDLS